MSLRQTAVSPLKPRGLQLRHERITLWVISCKHIIRAAPTLNHISVSIHLIFRSLQRSSGCHISFKKTTVEISHFEF